MTPQLIEIPPRHPKRDAKRLASAIARLQDGDWTRLEGAPDTEAALRNYHGGGEVWYVASGTAAIEAILLGHGIGHGDEVVTTPYTWGATVAAILAIGAVPVFADIKAGAPLLDPSAAASMISARTKAILAVHLLGFPCDMDDLRALADTHDLLLFEDGSQAHGARFRGERVGRFGHASAFSCMGLKPLGGTEGGYCMFEDSAAAEAAYLHGKHPRGLPPEQAARLGDNGLLDSLQLGWRPCAIGAELVRAGLATLDQENEGRRRNARYLRELLADLPGIHMDDEPPDTEPVYHLLSLHIDHSVLALTPDDAIKRLSPMGVDAFRYIATPLHRLPRMNWQTYEGPPVFWHHQLQEMDMNYANAQCPNAEARSAGTIELSWNWTRFNPQAMEQMYHCLRYMSEHSAPGET